MNECKTKWYFYNFSATHEKIEKKYFQWMYKNGKVGCSKQIDWQWGKLEKFISRLRKSYEGWQATVNFVKNMSQRQKIWGTVKKNVHKIWGSGPPATMLYSWALWKWKSFVDMRPLLNLQLAHFRFQKSKFNKMTICLQTKERQPFQHEWKKSSIPEKIKKPWTGFSHLPPQRWID